MLQFEANPPCQEDHAKPLSLTSLIPVREFGMGIPVIMRVRREWQVATEGIWI